MKMRAIISDCGLWRYLLECDFLRPGPTLAFGLHNPSTATAEQDDPTWRRGRGFATAWGAGKVIYVNPWAARATNPKDLWKMGDPVGPENDSHIAAVAQEVIDTGGFFVFAWGAVSPPKDQRHKATARLQAFDKMIRDICWDVRALGVTKDGQPRHPLYLPKDARPTPYPAAIKTVGEYLETIE